MNYEDAIKKGLDIGAVKHLFIVNIAAILVTISLTIIMREYIVRETSESLTLSSHGSQYMYLLQHTGFLYDHTLLRIALNEGMIANNRYGAVGVNGSDTEEKKFIAENSLTDFRAYSDKRIDQRWTSLDEHFSKMMQKEEKSSSFFYLLFERKIELEMVIEQDSPSYSHVVNVYNGLALLVNSVVYQITHNLEKNQLSGRLDNVDLNIFLRNTLSGYLIFLSKMPQTLRTMISENLGSLSRDILIIYVINIGLMIVAMTCSILFFVNIVRTFRRVCQCLLDLKIEDIETRSSQLAYVTTLMEREKLQPQNLKCLTAGGDRFKKKKKKGVNQSTGLESIGLRGIKSGHQRKQIAGLTKSFYFFTLLTSMIVLSLFYIGQFVFSGVIVTTLVSKLDKIDVLYTRETNLLELTGLIQQYRSAVLHTVILGRSEKLETLYFSRYNQTETTSKSRMSDLIDLISKPLPYSSNSIDATVNEQINGVMTGNICAHIDYLKQRTFLCSKLDVQIPQKGMVQAFYHITNQIDVWMKKLASGSSLVPVLNSPEYVSYELAVTSVYDRSMATLVQVYYDYIHYTLTVDIGNVETLITIAMVVMIVLSTLFTILSFRDIFRVKEELTYCFQTISIDGVVENQRIRVAFLRLFALDNQYFS